MPRYISSWLLFIVTSFSSPALGLPEPTQAKPYRNRFDAFPKNTRCRQLANIFQPLPDPAQHPMPDQWGLPVYVGCNPFDKTTDIREHAPITVNISVAKNWKTCNDARSFLDTFLLKPSSWFIYLVAETDSETLSVSSLLSMLTDCANKDQWPNPVGLIVGPSAVKYLDDTGLSSVRPMDDTIPSKLLAHDWVTGGTGQLDADVGSITFRTSFPSESMNDRPGRIAPRGNKRYRVSLDQSLRIHRDSKLSKKARTALYQKGSMPPNCLGSSSSSPTCTPVGGWSVFGTTRKDQPSLLDETEWRSTVPQRTIALIARASDVTALGRAPSAGTSAAALSAALAVFEAIRDSEEMFGFLNQKILIEDGSMQWQPAQLVLLAAVGDDTSLAGSGRFLVDLSSFKCLEDPSNRSETQCTKPQMDFANFTSVKPEDLTYVIHLEQLGRTTTKNPIVHGPSSSLKTKLISAGAVNSIVDTMPPNGAWAFLGASAQKQIMLWPATVTTIQEWAVTWSGASRPMEVVALTNFDASFPPETHSISDTPEGLNIKAIEATATAVLSVLHEYWSSEYTNASHDTFISTTQILKPPDQPPTLNSTFLSRILNCFTVDSSCPEFSSVLSDPLDTNTTMNFIADNGFSFAEGPTKGATLPALLVHNLLNYLLAPTKTDKEDKCPCKNLWEICINDRCVRRQAWFQPAYAPALEVVSKKSAAEFQLRSGLVYKVGGSEMTSCALETNELVNGIPRCLQQVAHVQSYAKSSSGVGGGSYAVASKRMTLVVFLIGLLLTLSALACGGGAAFIKMRRSKQRRQQKKKDS